MKPTVDTEVCYNRGTAKVELLLGEQPVNKIDLKISSFAPPTVQPNTAKERTVK